MLTQENTFTISDLRKNTLKVLAKMYKSDEPITIFSNSKPVAVLMSIVMYTELQQDADSTFDSEKYSNAWDFLINPPKEILITKKGLNAVDIIRKDRD
ncbi:MAG: type II toxin-antitoxin system prevent-host-death family antitoxin [Candidatus Gracilibacteria bacterium]